MTSALFDPLECDSVHFLNKSAQCSFVQANEECHGDEKWLAYTSFVYCAFGSGNTVPALGVLLIGLLVMFLGLGVTADEFLTPSLIVISDSLRLSQNIAGVTFLAFGNGAPDIISSLAGIQQARPALVIGELFGAGIFVTCIVAGSICLTQDFSVMERPFLRDVIFYIGATYWAFFLFYSREITIYHSVGFIVLYIAFILVVVLSRLVYQRFKESEAGEAANSSAAARPGPQTWAGTLLRKFKEGLCTSAKDPPVQAKNCKMFNNNTIDDAEMGVVLRRFSFRESTSHRPRRRTLSGVNLHHHRQNSIFIITTSENEKQARARSRSRSRSRSPSRSRTSSLASSRCSIPRHDSFLSQNGSALPPTPHLLSPAVAASSLSALVNLSAEDVSVQTPRLSPLRELWLHLRPLDLDEWPSKSWYSKVGDVCRAPIYFIMTITIPVVDYENDKNNWCRLLNSCHCVISPLFIVVVTHGMDDLVGGFPVALIVLAACLVLAILVFFTSKYEEAPRYHWVFGYVGFFVSVAWIYVLANEVVSMLKTMGIVIGLSDAFLGMTVLAWGNSIGDFISNLSVARQGYPRMAISACYGGPLLNLLLGFGIPYTLKLAQVGGRLSLEWSSMIGILYGTICHTLVSTLVVMLILRFNVKRIFGAYLILVYALYCLIAILLESKVI